MSKQPIPKHEIGILLIRNEIQGKLKHYPVFLRSAFRIIHFFHI